MEIKRDITLMLEPLIETTREAERDKYLPNDRLLIAQIQLIYFPSYPRWWGEGNRKKVEFLGRRRGGRQQKRDG